MLPSCNLLSLPVAVSGSFSTKMTSSGIHHLAILPVKNSSRSARVAVAPGLRTTTSSGRSGHFWCGTAMAAACATAGWATARFSISIELIHSLPDLMTSLVRSVICM